MTTPEDKYSPIDVSIIPSMESLMAAFSNMLANTNPNNDFRIKDYPEIMEGYEPEEEDEWDKDDGDTGPDLPTP